MKTDLRLQWTLPVDANIKQRGNSLGYATSSVRICEALQRKGVVFDDKADIALHYGFGGLYKPVEGKKNVIYTMFESPHLPPEVHEPLRNCDLIITPSLWCGEIFERHTNKPIWVVPLGVDPSFTYKKRQRRKDEKFRWLYVGAPNYRKITIVPELYSLILSRANQAHLYLKLTGCDLSDLDKMLAMDGVEEVEENLWVGPNCTVDNRYISQKDLVKLYHDSHGFFFLTCGEGFGLTGLEAMATGLSPIITDYSGVKEYATRSNCRLVPAKFKSLPTKDERTGEVIHQWLGWPVIELAMEQVQIAMTEDPKITEKKGRLASKTAKAFTWDFCAEGIIEAIRSLGD
jgi:glycosyltransferase involved in cell wall biosynthesis